MSVQKERKVRKLKRKRIWPSILFYIAFTVLGFCLIFVFANWFLSYVLEKRMDDVTAQAHKLSKTISMREKEYGDINKAIDQIYENMFDDKRFCIVDKDGNIVVQKSDSVPDQEQPSVYEDNLKVSLYIQDNDIIKVDEFGNINIEFVDFELLGLFGRTIKGWNEEHRLPEGNAVDIPCWIECKIPDSENSLFLNESLSVGKKDVCYMMLACMFMMFIMSIPMIFLFVNAISSVITQRRMIALLYLDTVTGGRNWLYLKHHGEKTLQRGKNAKYTYAILDIQMNKYRNYCACHSVSMGEELLEKLYLKIADNMLRGDICARYAKSNYAVMFKCISKEHCENKIKVIMNQLVALSPDHRLSFNVGVYLVSPNVSSQTQRALRRRNVNLAEMYNCACAARASIVCNDVNGFAFYNQKMIDEQLWEHKVDDMMEQALLNEEFEVYLQPKYSPSDGKLVGAEALVRWISPTEGFINPGRFIPIFENNGFILLLDDYMISHVAKLVSDWKAQDKDIVPISVNVSRAHFSLPDLAEHIKELVDTYNTPHEYIELELTESAFFDDKRLLIETVKRLKDYGFAVSMDDFGSGYSSLNSLKDLPLDVLKLDAEFFRGEDGEKRGEIVISEAIQLAKSLDMKVVAEGIEKKEQVDFLAMLNCDMIQGYYFAKPMPVKEFEMLEKYRIQESY